MGKFLRFNSQIHDRGMYIDMQLYCYVQECSRTPAEVEREAALKQKLEEKEHLVSNLEHSVAVLKAKVGLELSGPLSCDA